MDASIYVGLIGLLTTCLSYFIGSRKRRADAQNVELNNIHKAIVIWQDCVKLQATEISNLKAEVTRLEAEVLNLTKEIKSTTSENRRLININKKLIDDLKQHVGTAHLETYANNEAENNFKI